MLGIDPRAARATWTALLIVLLFAIAWFIRETVFVFVISMMFAYLLYPLFDAIDRRLKGKSRGPALALTYLLVLGVLTVFGAFVGSKVGGQAAQLAAEARKPGFEDQLREWQVLGLPVGAQITEHYQEIVSRIPSISLKVLSASTNLIYVVLVPILSFFILKDGRRIRDTFLEMLDRGRQATEDLLTDAHLLMLQYMRALLFLCLATFITFSIVLSIMGLPYSILLASIAFPLEFIPVFGPLSAAGIIIAVSLFSHYPHLLWVVIFLGAYRLFQDYVLSPHLMSRGVELHPVLIIFGVLAGGEIGGVPGVFLSVPILALLRLAYHRLRKKRVIGRVAQ